jgi:potassium-transporting ATPase KdpC subunit
MFTSLRTATLLLIALTLMTGGLYPLAVTVIAQVAFRQQANGSLVRSGNQFIGSELIGQSFTGPEYFWGRLSATGQMPCHAAASSGSNYGPMNPALKQAVEARIAALREAGSQTGNIPVDLVTASGSGLDPHISPAAAEFQVPRVAQVRGLSEDRVRELVKQFTAGRQSGVLGEPGVHVLRLNLALNQLEKRE